MDSEARIIHRHQLAVNLEIGFITPPVGLNLFVAMAISRMTLPEVFKACLPLIGLMLLSLVIITYVPWFSTYLPELIYR